MSLNDFLFGSKDKISKLSNYTPEQSNLLKSIFPLLQQMQQGGYGDSMKLLQDYLNPESDVYKNFEQPYLDRFNQETVPGLAEQFAGKGALASSGFGQSLSAAGGNLQNSLAAMKSGMQKDSIQTFLNQYNNQQSAALGAQPFTYKNQQGSQGFLPQVLSSFASNASGGGLSGIAKLLSSFL